MSIDSRQITAFTMGRRKKTLSVLQSGWRPKDDLDKETGHGGHRHGGHSGYFLGCIFSRYEYFFRGEYFLGVYIFQGWIFLGANIFHGWIFFRSEYFSGWIFFQSSRLPIETMCFDGSSYCSLVLTLLSCQYITYWISGLMHPLKISQKTDR